MRVVAVEGAVRPFGHYSPAIVHGGLVYVSGQLAIDQITGEKRPGTAAEETAMILENLETILKAAGSNREHVLKTTVYVSDISLWDEVNKVYTQFFGHHRPARAVVPTKELHFGFKVEIEAISAVIDGGIRDEENRPGSLYILHVQGQCSGSLGGLR